MADIARIEERLDKVVAGSTAISMDLGGVKFATLVELMEFAKLMAVSESAVPSHLRGKPGTCLAICTKALRFGFDPFSLAEHSYTMVKSTKVDGSWQDVETIAYDSFVIHAIIEAHGNVTGRLIPTYEGEGDDRRCSCTGVVNGETLTVTSARLGDIKARIGRNDKGKLKGSPLWDTKPDQQLWYDTRRDWCRAHQPHILLGWYDKDELQEHGPDRARELNPRPSVGDRLKNKGQRGFNAAHVENHATGGAVTEAPVSAAAAAEIEIGPSATQNNDSQPHPHEEAEKPAADVGPPTTLAAGEIKKADLPTGWEITYAAALRRATKKEKLEQYASQYWKQYGGWAAAAVGTDAEPTAKAIFDAFANHHGNPEAIEEILRELI